MLPVCMAKERGVGAWRALGNHSARPIQDGLKKKPVALPNDIIYRPMLRLLQSVRYGNGLEAVNTYASNYELELLGVSNGAVSAISRAHKRGGKEQLAICVRVSPAATLFWRASGDHAFLP
jgi:hypothetical protein